MFLAMAVLLLHPQLAATIPHSADRATINVTAASTEAASMTVTEESLPLAPVSFHAEALPGVESSAELPEAPLPLAPAAAPPTPSPFISASRPMTVSVSELRAENRRKLLVWDGLTITSSGAATFDAWTTRRAITQHGAQELDPLLKPFAGNASLYAAIQVGPALMDFLGRKMMYSRHSWMRRAWWVPQSASIAASMFCGGHNLAYR
jgi:hypothetical protein